MTILIAGASGATGKLATRKLLQEGHHTRIIVRSPENLPEDIREHERNTIIAAPILDISDHDLAKYVEDCDAVMSFLGHTPNFRGIWGPPYRLVTNAVRNLCRAIKMNRPEKPVRFVLMNTSGNINPDLDEKVSAGEKAVLALLRVAVPPHRDNELAADYLRLKIGQDNRLIEWAAVRPDTLIDENEVSEYEVYPSPVRSALFNPGKTSRINVANFMCRLATNDDLWEVWQGQMPVIYNSGQ